VISNKIVSRIKKLMSLSKGSEGNESEVAARMARKLMMEHAISEEDLNKAPEDNSPLGGYYYVMKGNQLVPGTNGGGRRCAWWKRELFSTLTRYLDMRMSYMKGTPVITAYGFKNDMEVLEYLFSLCAHQIDSAAKTHLKSLRARGYYTSKTDGTAFRNSAVEGLASKLRDLKRSLREENPTGTALMVNRKNQINQWVKDNCSFGKAAWGSTVRAYSQAGYDAGRKVKLARGVGGDSRQSKQLA